MRLRSRAQLGQLLGVLQQGVQARREHGLRGVLPGRDELDEEDPEVDVGHQLAAELGLQDVGRQVV